MKGVAQKDQVFLKPNTLQHDQNEFFLVNIFGDQLKPRTNKIFLDQYYKLLLEKVDICY